MPVWPASRPAAIVMPLSGEGLQQLCSMMRRRFVRQEVGIQSDSGEDGWTQMGRASPCLRVETTRGACHGSGAVGAGVCTLLIAGEKA